MGVARKCFYKEFQMDESMKEEDYLNQIILKALKDKNFCEELKKNPKKVFEREFKNPLPSNLEIHVIEETENKKYLVIPFIDECSEKELENIQAGVGRCYSTVLSTCQRPNTIMGKCN